MHMHTVYIGYICVYVQMTESVTDSNIAHMPIVPNALLPFNTFISYFLRPSRKNFDLLSDTVEYICYCFFLYTFIKKVCVLFL